MKLFAKLKESYPLNPCIGYEEFSLEADLQLFPNPGNGSFHLNSDQAIAMMEVMGLDGRIIFSSENMGSSMQFELEEAPGLYFVNVYSESGELSVLKLMLR